MKIFLSSTAYDLRDFRDLIVDRLESQGHEVLYHESPTFPKLRGIHSHDQCIFAVEKADYVICIVDKRYGSKYAGHSFTFKDQTISVPIKTKKVDVIIPKEELSITWCELIHAFELAKPVITFTRQRTFDEKQTRRANQKTRRFVPAYVEKNEVFDLLDWIVKQHVDNWVHLFNSIVDFEKKLLSWEEEVRRSIVIPPIASLNTQDEPVKSNTLDANNFRPVTILVESQLDQIIISNILSSLGLHKRFHIHVAGGKHALMTNLKFFADSFSSSQAIVVVLDSDTTTETDIQSLKTQFNESTSGIKQEMHLALTLPEIEAWVIASVDSVNYKSLMSGNSTKTARQMYKDLILANPQKGIFGIFIQNLEQGMKASEDLRKFVELMKKLANGNGH